MSQQLVFVQGGGEGAYAEDHALADYLRQALGDQFEVLYPKFPGLESVDYPEWRTQAIDTLGALGDDAIIIAHSLGGPALLKVLAEDRPIHNCLALYLIAMPYKCIDGEWGTDDFAIANDFAENLPNIRHLVLYHSQDDEWVPFEHLALYAAKLPNATTVPLMDRGHSFMKQDFNELVKDIESLVSA